MRKKEIKAKSKRIEKFNQNAARMQQQQQQQISTCMNTQTEDRITIPRSIKNRNFLLDSFSDFPKNKTDLILIEDDDGDDDEKKKFNNHQKLSSNDLIIIEDDDDVYCQNNPSKKSQMSIMMNPSN